VDVTARFIELVQRPESELVLDEPAFLIAAHDHEVDVAAQLDALAVLADDAAGHDVDGLAAYLFGELGFAGNTGDYGDPRNSFLDEVLRRRLGLPITLGVVMIEVGRRVGVDLVGVGMPGHFLVGTDDGRFVDPFNGGTVLDHAGACRLFEATHPGAPFHPAYLDPVGPRAVLSRVLANLVQTFTHRAPASAVWALKLRLAVPGLTAADEAETLRLLRRLQARSN